MGNNTILVGVVGLGFGVQHIKGYQDIPGCRVAAVCSRTPETAAGVVSEYRIAQWTTDYEELLDEPQIQALSICTPVHLHHEMVASALAAGKQVLCEKPLGLSAERCRNMVDLSRQSGRVTMTNFGWRFSDAAFHVKSLMESRWLGDLFHVNARYMMGYRADPAVPFGWRDTVEEGGPGVLGDLGVNLIDMVRWWAGDFTEVFASSHRPIPERTKGDSGVMTRLETEDACGFMARLDCGARAVFHVSRCAIGNGHLRIELHGSGGAIAFDFDRGRMTSSIRGCQGFNAELKPIVPDIQAPATPQSHFMDAIRSSTVAEPGFLEGLKVQLVADSLVASDRLRSWITVPSE